MANRHVTALCKLLSTYHLHSARDYAIGSICMCACVSVCDQYISTTARYYSTTELALVLEDEHVVTDFDEIYDKEG